MPLLGGEEGDDGMTERSGGWPGSPRTRLAPVSPRVLTGFPYAVFFFAHMGLLTPNPASVVIIAY